MKYNQFLMKYMPKTLWEWAGWFFLINGIFIAIHGSLTLPWYETTYGFTNEGLETATKAALAGFMSFQMALNKKIKDE
jgi:hypothetical protein